MLISSDICAVGFDLDNTLFDRDASVRRLLLEWSSESPRIEKGDEFVDSAMDRDASGYGSRGGFFGWLAQELGHSGPNGGQAHWDRFRADLPRHVFPDPEAVDLLEQLIAADVPVAVLSNGSSRLQRTKIDAAGLAGLVPPRNVLISEEIGCAKPDPAAFGVLSEVFCGIPEEETLFVGDHPANDIAAAAVAGFQTCWMSRNRRAPEGLAANYTIETPAGLLPVICVPS